MNNQDFSKMTPSQLHMIFCQCLSMKEQATNTMRAITAEFAKRRESKPVKIPKNKAVK